MTRGHDGVFIVFEGIDGAGTTTQCDRYATHLRASKRVVHVTCEPSEGPVGGLLRLGLAGRLRLGASNQAQTMALLFAAVLKEAARVLPRSWGRWLPILALAIVALEFAPERIPLYDPTTPALFERLGQRPDGAILPVPWGACFDGIGVEGFLGSPFIAPHYQAAHRKPYIGGMIGRVPRHVYEQMKTDPFLQALLAAQSGGEPSALLRDRSWVAKHLSLAPVRYVLVNTQLTPQALQTIVKKWPVTLLDEEGPLRLYAVGS